MASPAAVLAGHAGEVTFVRADGAGGLLLSCSEDRTARIWDLRTRCSVRQISRCFDGGAPYCGAFSLSDPRDLCVSRGSDLLFFDLRVEGVLLRSPSTEYGVDSGEVVDVQFLDSNRLISAEDSGTLRLSNPQERRFLRKYRGHSAPVSCSAVCRSDTDRFASGGMDRRVCLWRASNGRVQSQTELSCLFDQSFVNPPLVLDMDWNAEGIVLGLGDGSVALLDSSGREGRRERLHSKCVVQTKALSPGRWLSVGNDCLLRVLDGELGVVRTIEYPCLINTVEVINDGTLCIADTENHLYLFPLAR